MTIHFSSTKCNPLTSVPSTSLSSSHWKLFNVYPALLTPPFFWNGTPGVSTLGLATKGKLKPWEVMPGVVGGVAVGSMKLSGKCGVEIGTPLNINWK